MNSQSNKVTIITGAASGIGLELAKLYLQKDYAVIGIDYNQNAIESISTQIPRIQFYQADISDKSRMIEICQDIISKFKRIDIVIANAGVGGLNPAEKFSLEIHEKTVNINALGIAYTLMPFIPEIIKSKGTLVGVSSMAGFRGLPKAASYSSTKAMQKVFMESLRVDLKPYGVNCLSVHPGFVKTAMAEHSDFDMPFMVTATKAAQTIIKAIEKRKSLLLFPFPMKFATFINRLLPNWLYDFLVPKLSKMKSESQAKIY